MQNRPQGGGFALLWLSFARIEQDTNVSGSFCTSTPKLLR